jgi:YHS domain-containing protein
MRRFLAIGLVTGLVSVMAMAAPEEKADKAKVMEGLRELDEFIGGWKGSGSTKPNPRPTDPFWSEKFDWSWRFKGDDVWLSTKSDGKFFKTAELRYLPARKQYQMTVLTPEGKKLVFEGQYKDDKLMLERTDKEKNQIQQVQMNTVAEGIRFSYRVQSKNIGTTIWRPDYIVSATKEGESLARTEKKNECVVSGGRGTMTVSFMGETYYVCCSGCADAFKENPKKYVDEFKAKKGKK